MRATARVGYSVSAKMMTEIGEAGASPALSIAPRGVEILRSLIN
jgi:hypothetical protein